MNNVETLINELQRVYDAVDGARHVVSWEVTYERGGHSVPAGNYMLYEARSDVSVSISIRFVPGERS